MSDIMRITVLNQELIAVTGNQAKQVLVENVLQQDAGVLKTLLSLSKAGVPVNFDQVFNSLKMTSQNDDAPDDGPYEMAGPYSTFQWGPPEGFIQPVGFRAVTEVNPVISDEAEEGEYTIHVEIKEGDTVIGTAEVSVKVVTIETALFEYENMLAQLSNAEIDEIRAQYAELESLRQVVNAAILSLPVEQPALMTRYYSAAGNQYASFKLITIYNARENILNVARVKNVGGNAPFSIVFKDSVCIGDASEAYLFYPEGYRAVQTGIANYPADQPDSIKSTLTPGQTNLVVGSNYVQGGRFVIALKVGENWYYATYEMNAAGTELTVVNNVAVSVPNAGDEYVSPLEAALQNAIAGTSISVTVAPAVADKEEDITATVSVSYPVFDAAIGTDTLLDSMVSFDKALPIGTLIELKNANTTIGTYVIAEAGVKEFFVSKAFSIARTVLNAHSGNEEWSLVISDITPGQYDLTVKAVAAKSDEFEVISSRYVLASHTEAIKIVDRRAALDAAIAGTEMAFTGDVIRDVGETVEIAVTTTYPVFSPDLDPALAVDTLLALSKTMPVGATLQVFADELLLGTYTELTGTVQAIWLNDVVNATNIRPNLVDRDSESVSYKYVFTGLVDSDYNLSLKTIVAFQSNFESIDARYVLASVEVPMTVTDKSNLMAKVSEAENLLVVHQPGDAPGCAAVVPRLTLQTAIDAAKVVRDNGDASRNEILNAISDLTAAIVEFKTFIVKWRTDKAGIQVSVDIAEDLLATTTAGTNIGQAPAEAITAYQAAYNAAYGVLTNTPDFVDYFDTDTFHNYQAQIDQAKTDLDAATVVFQDARVSDEDYAMAKVAEYEAAARAFYDSVRKKIRI
ncbi:hypothetical protein [Anaerospora hongkongensis]|uniref:hypothetical protein n=1 Tax=Anaerospora hongkongensis TaxID=244830 RepID=UPI0028979149|nr:hypothetical protein [Anaerospora hongkongensis]